MLYNAPYASQLDLARRHRRYQARADVVRAIDVA